ncbi:unnamed protein product [Orchesella dallaii]|uniref:Uncharacterized protein n=1 Tax=Orchesella dallaii TaxID=48710 RepID=A0ABP1S7I8_9HEXA
MEGAEIEMEGGCCLLNWFLDCMNYIGMIFLGCMRLLNIDFCHEDDYDSNGAVNREEEGSGNMVQLEVAAVNCPDQQEGGCNPPGPIQEQPIVADETKREIITPKYYETAV